jgi:galactokinase
MPLREDVVTCFHERHGEAPSLLVRAPGRVNLIGEHTDYNDGFVLPMAIDRDTWIALRPRGDGRVRLHSMLNGEDAEFALTALEKGTGWSEYPKGVAWALRKDGKKLVGWEGVTTSGVPLGAGLSSSASFELAVARAFAAVSGLDWDAAAMALLCQQAENRWVGVSCGIMDQMISAVGREGRAVLIDCRYLARTPVPLPPDTAVVIMDTATRRGLVDSPYNERRAQCEEAARAFGVPALRDVSAQDFERRAGELETTTRRRARHVVTEDARTLQAAQAMDVMVEKARPLDGCLGARMTGAGFGGCAVALVEAAAATSFSERVAADYAAATDLTPKIHVCTASAGAELLGDRVR